MTVSINQPAYIPWLGYFERIAASDRHIVLDHVQFEKNSFVNRNKVRTPQGSSWLTVPVRTKGKFGALPINDMEISGPDNWRNKHWQTIRQNYQQCPYFDEHAPFFEAVYDRQWIQLVDLIAEITGYLLDVFEIQTKVENSSKLKPEGAKDTLILNLCKQREADTYLSGVLGKDYLREELFKDEGITVVYQDYVHPTYQQSRYLEFESHLGAIDLLFNCGPDSGAILRGQI